MANRQVAPGELELVREFVNTREVEAGVDHLGSRATSPDWFAKRELLPAGARLEEQDLRETREDREAIRVLLLANNDGSPIKEAVKDSNRPADKIPLKVRFHGDETSGFETSGFETAESAGGALGRIFAVITISTAQGTWDRMKARTYWRRHAVGGESL